jgi:PBP1b-binding outer membrane lipoprotein LpoB
MTHLRLLSILGALAAGGCTTTTAYDNRPGPPTGYQPITESGTVSGGVGIESQDIVAMTDRMMRDILATPAFGSASTPPRVIVDSSYFVNEGSSRVNKNLITDRLRVELARAARGRMTFVGRENVAAVEDERELKSQGVTDGGTRRRTSGTAGADFRLTGRINSLDKVNPRTGQRARYNQITFEMLELESGIIAWSGMYEFQKVGEEDLIYR